MPPETITPETANGILDRLPPDVAGYAALALFILWIARKMYGEQLDDTKSRLSQVETSLANVSQEHHQSIVELTAAKVELALIKKALETSQKREDLCAERIQKLEERYEKRIAELEEEIAILRVRVGDVSESVLDKM